MRRLNKRRLARLKADIHLLDKRMAQTVAADANLAQRYELLTSMRGVGPTLAFTLIALLPELGQMSRKQIAALVGLALTTSTAASSKDIAASTAVACQSVTSSTWLPSAQPDTIPPSRSFTIVSPQPTRT